MYKSSAKVIKKNDFQMKKRSKKRPYPTFSELQKNDEPPKPMKKLKL